MAFCKYFRQAILCYDAFLNRLVSGGGTTPPTMEMAVVTIPALQKSMDANSQSLMDILRNGIVWNTPKSRKTLEVRTRQKYGSQTWGSYKHFIRVNRRIRVDYKSGEFFELGRLAPKSYKKVLEETSVIKNKISDTFGSFSPRDKEAEVLYEGESVKEDEGKILVQMETQRPTFFSRNLTQKTHTSSSTSNTTVRPSGLA